MLRHEGTNITRLDLNEVPGVVKFIEAGSRNVVAKEEWGGSVS